MNEDCLYYLDMEILPSITLDAWLYHAPVMLSSLRDKDFDSRKRFLEWNEIDVNPQLGIRVLASPNEDAEELFRIPPRNWVPPHKSDTITSELEVAFTDTLIHGRRAEIELNRLLDTIEVDVPLPEPLRLKWQEIQRITKSYLASGKPPSDAEDSSDEDIVDAW